MKNSLLATTAIGASILLSGTAAMADVSASEVWADWRKNMSMYGEDSLIVGAETMSGDTLTVSDVAMSINDSVSSVRMDMGDIVLVENGDGTVSISLAETYPMIISSADGDGNIKISVVQQGLEITVSGDASALNYEMTADKYGVTIDEITEDGKPVEGDVRMTMNNVAGSYVSAPGNMQSLAYDMTVGSVDMLVDIAPPGAPGDHFTMSGKISGLAMVANILMPNGPMNLENPFAGGLSMDGNYSFGKGDYIFDVKAEGEQTAGSVSTGEGTLEFAMDESGLNYDSLTNDVAVNISGAALPFPIEVSLSQYGAGIQMPFSKTEEPTDFGLRLNLTDLQVNDVIWMMGDPTGALPHDPATLLLDLSGKTKLFFDLMDPTQAEAMAMSETPGELHALTLNKLLLSIAGAEVTGTGDFTFDNSDKETFDGMPAPTGDVTVNIKGANKLIDSLVSMGLLPEDQAMMGRMMMGMFARTTGDDELSSKIEINDQGHIIANGQRIQ